MRTSLFLSTLFAVSMLGGAAFAERPAAFSAPAREPQVMERLRSHGDVNDKVYRTADTGARSGASASSTGASSGAHGTRAPANHGGAPVDHGADRVNCSDTGVDCLAAKGQAAGHAGGGGGEKGPSSRRDVRPPAFLDKVLGSDRTNFNEAGEAQGMSPRAAQRLWSHAAGPGGGEKTAVALDGVQRETDRKSHQASDARMASNEDDVGFMSPKAARKEWAKASIAAGTWTGPAKEPISNAAIRIAQQRAHEGTADKHAASVGSHGESHGSSDQAH
jgi:hypothetical protein